MRRQEHAGLPAAVSFQVGVNYWPRTRAMYWWDEFMAAEVEDDFARLAACGFAVVRLFLLWEAFQPSPDRVSAEALRHLEQTMDIAQRHDLRVMPTLFCGHMSGANWLPAWMLMPGSARGRFPVVCQGRVRRAIPRNPYTEPGVREAQRLLCQAVAERLNGHPALEGYDLGNEASNWACPPRREAAREWLEVMVSELKRPAPGAPVTLGMHAEDLEEDRGLWPQDAALFCDYLCMHGYPFYLAWVEDPLDVLVLPFLGALTRWLGGKPVLFQEFGIHSRPVIPPDDGEELAAAKVPAFSEAQGLEYYRRAWRVLWEEGMRGAYAWCYGDYVPSLWQRVPLAHSPHERHFGLFRHDGSAKPAAATLREFLSGVDTVRQTPPAPRDDWVRGEDPSAFYGAPRENLVRLYQRYRRARPDPDSRQG